jgi:hypothetical protein
LQLQVYRRQLAYTAGYSEHLIKKNTRSVKGKNAQLHEKHTLINIFLPVHAVDMTSFTKKNIFLSRVKRQGFSQENLYILGAPAHPFALRALHGSPLPCIHSKPAESLAATGRGFLGLAKRKIE